MGTTYAVIAHEAGRRRRESELSTVTQAVIEGEHTGSWDDFGVSIEDVSTGELKAAGGSAIKVVSAGSGKPSRRPASTAALFVPDDSALNALKAEAEAEVAGAEDAPPSLHFDYDGEDYTIPGTDDWDMEIFEFVGDREYLQAVRLLLGPEQWVKFKTQADPGNPDGPRIRKTRSMPQLLDIFAKAGSAVGVDPKRA